MRTEDTLVAAVVGIDGCGKSTTFRDALDVLAASFPVAGVGEVVLSGNPDEPVRERSDIPLTRSARLVGRLAKGRNLPTLYRDLKFLEFIERTRIRDYIVAQEQPTVLVTDGDPLVNIASWAAARFYREELAEGDNQFLDVLHYMAGDRRIPPDELPRYLRRAWQLVLLNEFGLARFHFPDRVFLLQIDPATAIDRIRARGRTLQSHENEEFLAELANAYARVCSILEDHCEVGVTRIRVDQLGHDETVQTVVDTVREEVVRRHDPTTAGEYNPDSIEIIATTMSGSLRDQRKVGSIEREFRSRTSRQARVHLASSHREAAAVTHDIVAQGGRTLVSAGGAGTFNAVLEGSHLNGDIPSDLRLAFLRKGSADLIGKTLHIPDDLPEAVEVIVDGIERNRCIDADILTVEATEPDGATQQRHMVGFGGLGAFGEVPRFTETRVTKLYKGILGSLFGDLGPFYVGLTLAVVWWWLRNLFGRIPSVQLTLDEEPLPPERWGAVMVLNGDLGKDFPLGRGLSMSSGSFRVVALRYRGLRTVIRQFAACRTAAVLDDPDAHAAVVADVHSLVARPTRPSPRYMVNVDGLRMMTKGTVRVSVSGRVRLVEGREPPALTAIHGPNRKAVGPWKPSSTS
jgi:diacylglycerol kinase family enzyme/thymidylate kinase